jgi:hypothetical protein
VRTDKRASQKADKKASSRVHKRGIVGYSKKSALLEEAITHMNTGKYGRSSAALKELLALDPQNIEARHLFATLHLRLGSLVTARQAFESLANEAIGRQDYWLAESLLREYLAAGPRCVPFLEQLSLVALEKGDEMAAVVELGKAIEILRDDPDPDNPQKAAQLYAKIRELAPASTVAFQLASLFDVQTGEFLVKPSAPSSIASEDPPRLNDSSEASDTDRAKVVAEYPLPEVLPWEMIDELPADETDADLSQPTASVEAADPPAPSTATEEVHQLMEASLEPALEATSLEVQEPAGAETVVDDPISVPTTDEAVVPPPSDIPSPMPWEQMADASVQIPEPETAPAQDGVSTLESILASLRTEETTVAPPLLNEEPPQAAPAVGASLLIEPDVPPPSTVSQTGASLTAPMPWEQISDPAVQIPVSEIPSSTPAQDSVLVAPEPPEEFAPAEASTPQAMSGGAAAPPMELDHSPESATSAPAEVPQVSSFSWNSVFDKAWKFTASTMAPSPPVPLEKGLKESVEPQPVESPAAEEHVAAEELVVAPAPIQEEPAASVESAIPVSLVPMGGEPAAHEEAASPPAEPPPAPVPASEQLAPSHWNTGEVAVQVHRPSKKKKRWDKDQEEGPPAAVPPSAEPLSESDFEPRREWKTIDEPAPLDEPESPVEVAPLVESVPPVQVATPVETPPSPPIDLRADWMKATESITFARTEPPPSQAKWREAESAAPPTAEWTGTAVSSAVDVLFAPSATSDDVQPHEYRPWSKPRPRLMARLHRVRIGISSFIGSCFSTTRSLTFLAFAITIAIGVVAAAGIGTLAVTWMTMEDPPSSLYQTLTISPSRTITDAKRNGYLLLLGFDAPDGQDPVHAGYERKPQRERDLMSAQVCLGEEAKTPGGTGGASDHMVKGWIRSGDLVAGIKGQGGALKSLTSREATALGRYQQWLTMPFDDWGFGQPFSPDCTRVLFAHRLYVLEGFSQDLPTGLERLEADVQAWRAAMGQAKSLPMKMLAATAVQDDASVASGLLNRTELDGPALARLSKMIRPLDQMELSIRWPMQSQFVLATKTVSAELKDDGHDRPWHASLAAAMRLPVQRRANAYAEYYEAANKAVAGGRYTNLPKVSNFVRTPPSGVMDYLANPVEHIVGIEALPLWDPFVHRIIEMDAQLRLAGLQAWLRRGPQDGDVLTRLAKAGQAYYDPFTGLPMLVNQRKGVIYSVGRDGKDQEGDGARDVTAMIPGFPTSEPRRVSSSVR